MLLDAAAFVPTNRLDLGALAPDFVALSFYKMFGWPTGVGCLLARREALAKLERPWFSGGTIVAAFVQREWYQSAPGAAHFEDGTVNFLNLPAVEIGLRLLDRIGIDTIHDHVERARRAAPRALGALRHPTARRGDGLRAARLRAARRHDRVQLPPSRRPRRRRALRRPRRAARTTISLRTGCFCNPGAGEVAFTISRETLVGGEFGEGMTLDDYVRAIGLPSGGAVRASLGIASNCADVDRFARVRRRVRRSRRGARRPAAAHRLLGQGDAAGGKAPCRPPPRCPTRRQVRARM